MVAAGDHAKTAAGAFMNVREPPGVGLLINERVVGLFRAELMQPDLHRAMVVIELDVEERPGIQRPHHAAIGLLDQIGAVLERRPVAHPDREIFRAFDVRAPGLQRVIRRMPGTAELEVFVAGCELVAIEDDGRFAAVARGSAVLFVLAALAEFPQVGIRPVLGRHAGIVLLDAGAHFLDQRLLQLRGLAEQALGIGVLGLQIAADLRVEHAGIAQHLLPFCVLQPGIIVGHGNAVHREGMRVAGRHRRRDRGGWLGHGGSFRQETVEGFSRRPVRIKAGGHGHRPAILDIAWI